MIVLDLRTVLGELEADDLAAMRSEELDAAIPWATFLVEVRSKAAAGSWADDAACKGQTHLMFPERGQSSEPARAMCASCTVFDECRAWSDGQTGPKHGFVAGESARQRRERRRVPSAVGEFSPDLEAA